MAFPHHRAVADCRFRRGGKKTDWEGGIREFCYCIACSDRIPTVHTRLVVVARLTRLCDDAGVSAFVSGGAVPKAVRGQTRDGYIHAADWYPTLCALAGGHDCRDAITSAEWEVPPVDGFDMWKYLTGAESESPRTEFVVERCEGPYPANLTLFPECSGAYIRGDYKIILGFQI